VLASWRSPRTTLVPLDRGLQCTLKTSDGLPGFRGNFRRSSTARQRDVWDRGTLTLAEGTDPPRNPNGKIKSSCTAKSSRRVHAGQDQGPRGEHGEPWLLLKDAMSTPTRNTIRPIIPNRSRAARRWRISADPRAETAIQTRGTLRGRTTGKRAAKRDRSPSKSLMLATLVAGRSTIRRGLFEIKWTVPRSARSMRRTSLRSSRATPRHAQTLPA